MTMKASKKVLVLLGPNLNLTGLREKSIYGAETAETINQEIRRTAEQKGYECEIFQSNHEGMLIDKLHEAKMCIRDSRRKAFPNCWSSM